MTVIATAELCFLELWKNYHYL